MRVNKVPGENNPKSMFEQIHKVPARVVWGVTGCRARSLVLVRARRSSS